MPEDLVHPSQNDIGDQMGKAHHVEDEVFSSGQASHRRRDSGNTGRQDFSQIHTADNSRNHFGNVYNNIYQNNTAHPEFAKVSLELMDALGFKGMTDRLMAIGPACAETCTWFLRRPEYTSWRDPARRHRHNGVLWIKGKAGTGKSTLMRYIHDHAQQHYQDDVDIAFFLNGRSPDQLVKSVEGMYRSILYQLYDRIPRFKAAAAKRVAITNKQVWSIEILKDMIRQSILHLTSDEKATIYIDALDECELDQVRSAVEFFESLSRSATTDGKRFLICFSSRYYPHITMQSHEEVKLDTLAEHLADIKTFLASEFTIRSPFRSELQTEIEERCSGIFLWVVLVVKLLKRSFDKGATRSQLRETLKSMPHELNDLFAKITESAGSEFAIAMRWVLCARDSLHPSELYFAIQISSGRLSSVCWNTAGTTMHAIRNYILHVSRGLIECTWESARYETVQFVHESVREYLRSWGGSSSDSTSSKQLEIMSHAKMAEDCRNYLKICARCRAMTLPSRDADVSNRDACNFLSDHPLLNYVLNSVFVHLELAHSAGSINNSVLDTFPLGEFVGFFNIRACPRYDEVERHLIQCAILPNHTATLLMLLIWYQCYSLVEVTLRSSAPVISRLKSREKRSQKSPIATVLDLTTCCGGFMASPLHAAVVCGREDVVQLLLDRGADVNIPGRMLLDGTLQLYDSPLKLACDIISSASIMKLLLEHGASVDTLSPLTGRSALHTASSIANLEKLELLLSKNANVNLRSGFRDGGRNSFKSWTALHLACAGFPRGSQNPPAVIRALLGAGADVNAVIQADMTPLIFAVINDKLEEAKVLIDHGANTEYRSTFFGTAIVAAHPDIADELASRIRLRALQGRNRYLRPAPRPKITRTAALPSRIAGPVQPQSRRKELPLQYRHPPKSPPPVLDEREYADALTDLNLQLLNESEGDYTYAANNVPNHKTASQLGSQDESDWSNAVHVHSGSES